MSVTRLFETLKRSSSLGCVSDTVCVVGVEEGQRVPVLDRGISLAFLRDIRQELVDSGRGNCDSGQLVHGSHTTSSATDFREFDRRKDDLSIRACTLHTGLSFVEACVQAGLVTSEATKEPYFGRINTFVSYTWRGNGATFLKLVDTILAETTVTHEGCTSGVFLFIDIFVCAQNRGVRLSGTCPNQVDVGHFETIIQACRTTLFYATPLVKPLALERVWCLFEILHTAKNNLGFYVICGADDRELLRHKLRTGERLAFLGIAICIAQI